MTGYEAGNGKVVGHIGPENLKALQPDCAGPLEFYVEKELEGNLYKAAVTAKMSGDTVKIVCGEGNLQQVYRLQGSTVVDTAMDFEAHVRRVYAKTQKPVAVQVSATGNTAQETLDTVCGYLFPAVEVEAESVKKDA